VRVLVFDLDDTLFPEREYVASGFRAVDRWIATQRGVAGFFETALSLYHAGRRGRIFDEALEVLGVVPDPALVPTLVGVYRDHSPNIRLHADSARAIAAFRHSFHLAIITDGYHDVQKKKVAALGIGPQFEAIVYTDELGRSCWKPSPEPFLKVMRTFGAKGSECLYVGDNAAKDFVAAKALGWLTVQVVREGGEYSKVVVESTYQAHFTIQDLGGLTELVAGPVAAGSERTRHLTPPTCILGSAEMPPMIPIREERTRRDGD
jgi:putative hydrolase of the HAD superfamily